VPTHEAVRQIPAETEATVVRIHLLPGSQIKAFSQRKHFTLSRAINTGSNVHARGGRVPFVGLGV
jgi:hypothetical protein